ncbi:MAG: flagellar biosynthesis anti-sigma factor FlgM [Gammaproteobacteria bacterium]|nr:flagellar biosynthesis anti-sigma factor FlgM [Gammaproteobacteria bacterium]
MLNQPPFNTEPENARIRTIREQIDEDNYPVNTHQIADKIIDLEIALSNSE